MNKTIYVVKNIMKNKYILLILLLVLLVPNIFALVPNANMKIFAVAGDKGAQDATLNIKIVPGAGKIFSSIDESIVGSSTQESFKNAISVANKNIGNNIRSKYDFTVDIESSAYSIDGPSAGGAMALLIISMFKDTPVSNKVSMTGTITADGYIGDVGGVYQKTKKAAEVGIKLFFVPQGNRTQVINEGGNIQQIDLIEYAYKEWGLKIIEVSTMDEILAYAFRDIDSIDINTTQKEKVDDFIYTSISYSKAVEPFKDVTYNYIKQTDEKLVNVKKHLASSSIKDTEVLQNLLSTINYSEELLNVANKYYQYNYFYSAANNSFLAYVNVITVDEIITNPSILADSSIIFNLRIKELEEKITLTENRSYNCSLENLEWCVGARQRVTWARDKLEKISVTSTSNNFTKIQDYAYAVAWTDIANSFLDLSITKTNIYFVESGYFKKQAQDNIISVENQLILVAPEIATSEDLRRRLDAAKRNYDREWYVTSLYDSATALAVIKTQEENKNTISTTAFTAKYDLLASKLRSQAAMNNENNVWSKTFLDHAIYYYNAYNENKMKDEEKAKSNMNVSNSILNFSNYLYDVETLVLDYYLNTDIDALIVDITSSTEGSVIIVNKNNEPIKQVSSQNVYVYSKERKDFNLYLIVAALFLMIVAIIVEVERFKRYHSKEGIIKQIGYLDEKLLDGKISSFTYKEMREKYLLELEKIKSKEASKKKELKKTEDVLTSADELEKRVIDKQIEELERRRKEISLRGKSESIKSVKEIVSNIKPTVKEDVKKQETFKKPSLKKETSSKKEEIKKKETKKKKDLSIKKGL